MKTLSRFIILNSILAVAGCANDPRQSETIARNVAEGLKTYICLQNLSNPGCGYQSVPIRRSTHRELVNG